MVPQKLTFSPLFRRQIEADFSGGHITSDAGLLLLREVDEQHRRTQRLAKTLTDQRDSSMIRHQLDTMVRQRVYGVAAGYEDLNDHDALRVDQALQTATGEDAILAGPNTGSGSRGPRTALAPLHFVASWGPYNELESAPPNSSN